MFTHKMPTLTESDRLRFWEKVSILGPDECWLWLAGKKGKGYGEFSVQGKSYAAHRISCVLSGKTFTPEAPNALHSCDNPPCVNPAHLRTGTTADNHKDMDERNRRWTPSGWTTSNKARLTYMPRGENQWNAKLTAEQVLEIRRLHDQERTTKADLARQFHVTTAAIRKIILRKTWKHV